jgi:hypothetical protein
MFVAVTVANNVCFAVFNQIPGSEKSDQVAQIRNSRGMLKSTDFARLRWMACADTISLAFAFSCDAVV